MSVVDTRPRLLLLFPPVAPLITHPELGVPQLSAFLRSQGLEVEQVDLNVQFLYRYLREPPVLRSLLDTLTPEALSELSSLPSTLEEKGAYLGRRLQARTAGRLGARDVECIVRRFLDHMEGVIPPQAPPAREAIAPLADEALDLDDLAGRVLAPHRFGWVRWYRTLLLLQRELLQPSGYQADQLQQAVDASNPVLDRFLLAELEPRLRKPTAVLGLSIHGTQQVAVALRIARLARGLDDGLCVVLGGPWCAAAGSLLLEEPLLFRYADAVVPNAGERPLRGIVKALTQGTPLESVPGVVVRRGGQSLFRPDPAEAIPLEALPLPEFDGHPLELYPERMLPFQSIQGCTWGRCSFCYHVAATPQGAGPAPPKAGMSPGLVEKAVRFAQLARTRYGVEILTLADNSTPALHGRQLARGFERSGVRIRWQALARLERGFSRDCCRHLAQAGCQELFFGLETAEPEALVRLQKGITAPGALRVLESCASAGIQTTAFLLSYPGQSYEGYEKTLQFVCEHARFITRVIPLRFELGRNSAVYRQPEQLGLKIPVEGHNSFDVFNLPFVAERFLDEVSFRRLTSRYLFRLSELNSIAMARGRR